MDQLTFLGTGHALAYHCYTTCLALSSDNERYFVTDGGGGNGVLLQLERANISLANITDLFISHSHTDHLLGCVWMARVIGHLFDAGKRTAPLTVYGHQSVLDNFRTICKMLIGRSYAHFDEKIQLVAVENGDKHNLAGFEVTFFDTGATKTVQYGWRATLSNGESLVFLGDEPMTDTDLPFAQDCDHMIHEAMCLEKDADRIQPHRIHHSTVIDACANARRAYARHLILFHMEDTDLDTRKARYTAEASAHFYGRVDAPDDLDTITF